MQLDFLEKAQRHEYSSDYNRLSQKRKKHKLPQRSGKSTVGPSVTKFDHLVTTRENGDGADISWSKISPETIGLLLTAAEVAGGTVMFGKTKAQDKLIVRFYLGGAEPVARWGYPGAELETEFQTVAFAIMEAAR